MSTAVQLRKVVDREHIIVVGAGFVGLMCGLEIQGRDPRRQVDIVAQTFLTDPHPMTWTTYISHCFFGCLKSSGVSLGQQTFDYMLAQAPSNPGMIHRFSVSEYFSMARIDDSKILNIRDIEEVAEEELISGAKHGATFTTVSVSPIPLATQMQSSFTTSGGRLFRGTVRHLRELAEGGVSSFQRSSASNDPVPPTAIVICVGVGARFLGGVEDTAVIPARIHVVRLRTTAIKIGKAFYDGEQSPTFFIIPLGNGDIIIGGDVDYEAWYPRPIRQKTDALLAKALSLCPEIVPREVEDREHFDLRSLVVWEGCDTFGHRKQGPRLEAQTIHLPDQRRNIPIVLSFGYGTWEFQVHREVAKETIDLLEAAIEQERQRQL